MSDYQTPFFLFDLAKVRARYERMSAAFLGAPLFYAVKANNHEQVLNTLVSVGSKFDIGSKHEAELMLALGVDPKDLIFSAPVKLQSHIRDTYHMGVDLFVFDSEDELAKIALLAPGSRVMARLAVKNQGSFFPLSMKFGAPVEQAASLLSDALELGLSPYGVAFHVGSQCTRKETWREAMEASAEVIDALADKGIICEALDIGGGFPIKYDEDVPSIEEIAEEVLDVFAARFAPEMQLILEPGRYLVGESAVLASTIIGRAKRGSEDWLFLDASAFHGLLEAQQVKGRFPYPVRTSHNGDKKKSFVLSGPTCDPDDTILAEVLLPDMKVGERLYIQNTGAYSFVYATNFHGFAPPEIHFIDDGQQLESLWGETRVPEAFVPEYGEEKRYSVEHAGETAVVYFGITNLPEPWTEILWDLYKASLTIDEAIQDQQCFDRDGFVSALNDSDYVKAVMTVNSNPAAFIMGTNNLEKASVGYINPSFVQKRFPDAAREGRFFYMPCVFTSPEIRNAGFLRQFVVALIDAIREKNWVLSLDTSDSRLFLPDVLIRIGEEEGLPIEKHLLGTQSYFAFTCKQGLSGEKQEARTGVTPVQS